MTSPRSQETQRSALASVQDLLSAAGQGALLDDYERCERDAALSMQRFNSAMNACLDQLLEYRQVALGYVSTRAHKSPANHLRNYLRAQKRWHIYC
jgi:hypothetical protein